MAAYHGVIFQMKEGILSVSSNGIVFREKDSEEEGTDPDRTSIAYEELTSKEGLLYKRHIPWRFVKRHRINDHTEPQAAMRLWICADYGDMGMDDETLVFGLANREQLKRLSEDITDGLRFYKVAEKSKEKRGSSVVSSMTTEQSHAERTETTHASSVTNESFNSRMTNVEPNKGNSKSNYADSLVLKVREHLLRVAEQAHIEGSSQGSHSDEILRSIYEHGNCTAGGGSKGSDHDTFTGMLLAARMIAEQLNSIQEEKSRNSSGDKSNSSTQQVPPSIPRHLKLDMTTNHGSKEDDDDGSMSRLSAASLEDSGQGLTTFDYRRYPSQSGLVSLPSVNEPNVLAASASTLRPQGHLGSQSHHVPPQSSDEEWTQMVGLVRQLDERDRQAKRRARSGSEHLVGRGRSSSMSSGSGTTTVTTPKDQQEQQELLKNRLLTQLYEYDMKPGAHPVVGGLGELGPSSAASSSTGARRRRQAQGPGGTDNKNNTPIGDGLLIEAYLVAQQSSRSTSGNDAWIGEKSTLEDTRRQVMGLSGELTEAEFLDALQAVIDNRKRAPPAVLVGKQGEKDIALDPEPELAATVTAAVVHPEIPRAAPEAPLDNFAGAGGTTMAHPVAAKKPIPTKAARIVEAPTANAMTRHEAMPVRQESLSPTQARTKKEEESSCWCCSSGDAAGVPLSEEELRSQR